MDKRYISNQIDALIKSRDSLQDILDDGANQIEQARKDGKDVSFMENTWTKMLNDYGHMSDQISKLHSALAA